MTKYFFSLFALLILKSASAQRSEIKFQVGYGIPLVNTPQFTTVSNGTYAIHSFSFGSGVRYEAGIIRHFGKNLSVQIDAAYLSGKRNSINQVTSNSYFNTAYYSKFYDVSPLVRFTINETKIKAYVAVGPVFGFGKFYREAETGSYGSSNFSSTLREYKGSFAFGAKTELGVQLQVKKIKYYAQLTVIDMRYAPASSEVTLFNVNSVSQLSNLTVAQRQTVYLTTMPAPSTTPNANQPTQALKASYAFDSISFNVGVMISL